MQTDTKMWFQTIEAFLNKAGFAFDCSEYVLVNSFQLTFVTFCLDIILISYFYS